MKGFRIEIQEDLSSEETKIAKKFADQWIDDVKAHDWSWKHRTRAGYSSYYRRGRFGEGVWLHEESSPSTIWKKYQLVFRRHTRHKRVFAIVKANTLTSPDGSLLNLNQCMCPIHRGGQKVKYVERPDTFVYFEVGCIKG